MAKQTQKRTLRPRQFLTLFLLAMPAPAIDVDSPSARGSPRQGTQKLSVGLVTDLFYEAGGREYYREDVLLCKMLRESGFNVTLVHLKELVEGADRLGAAFDVVLLRNTGARDSGGGQDGGYSHRAYLESLVDSSRSSPAVQALSKRVFNDLRNCHGDFQGKRHLVETLQAGLPVIPSALYTPSTDTSMVHRCTEAADFLHSEKCRALGANTLYSVKPLEGADSHGLQRNLDQKALQDHLSQLDQAVVVQPMVKFDYEVSFVFVGDEFSYAVYNNPDKTGERWEQEEYPATEEDVAVARRFVDWNGCRRGVQRVDMCRTSDTKELLLMELEDYNPWLSLQDLEASTREGFVSQLAAQLVEFVPRADSLPERAPEARRLHSRACSLM